MKLELSPTIILNVQFQNMHVYTSMVFTSTVYFIMHQNISYGHMQYLCKTHLFYARIAYGPGENNKASSSSLPGEDPEETLKF